MWGNRCSNNNAISWLPQNDPDQAYPDEESVQVGEYVPLHWEDGGEELEQEEGGQEGEGDARREATRQDITVINSIWMVEVISGVGGD